MTIKKIMILIAFISLVGCAQDKARITAASTEKVEAHVGTALTGIRDAKKSDDLHFIKGKLTDAEKTLILAKREVLALKDKNEAQAKQCGKNIDRLNYLELKYSETIPLIWKWRLISIGLIAGIVGFFILRQYFPFLKFL